MGVRRLAAFAREPWSVKPLLMLPDVTDMPMGLTQFHFADIETTRAIIPGESRTGGVPTYKLVNPKTSIWGSCSSHEERQARQLRSARRRRRWRNFMFF